MPNPVVNVTPAAIAKAINEFNDERDSLQAQMRHLKWDLDVAKERGKKMARRILKLTEVKPSR